MIEFWRVHEKEAEVEGGESECGRHQGPIGGTVDEGEIEEEQKKTLGSEDGASGIWSGQGNGVEFADTNGADAGLAEEG